MIRNLLIVTDHSSHAATNSLYELAIALIESRKNVNVWVCSKGSPENKDFFNADKAALIYATQINSSFAFHPQGLSFSNTLTVLERDKIDAVIVRMPQPLQPSFLRSLLTIVPSEKIINSPEGTIETSSKAFLLEVEHLCPSPSLCHYLEEAILLSKKMEIVLKPLYSYGGIGIVRLSKDYFWDGDHRYPVADIKNYISDDYFPMLAMRYLPKVSLGDKRTIIVNRQILGSALRLPAANSWICNVAHGGHAILSEPDENELKIENELTPLLFEKGVIMYGFDTLTDDNGKRVLSEINTLSIGGLGPLSELSGRPVLKQTADLLWDYLEKSNQ